MEEINMNVKLELTEGEFAVARLAVAALICQRDLPESINTDDLISLIQKFTEQLKRDNG
jgi:hypothetical protein